MWIIWVHIERTWKIQCSVQVPELHWFQNYRPLVAQEIDNSLIAPAPGFWDAFKNAKAFAWRLFVIKILPISFIALVCNKYIKYININANKSASISNQLFPCIVNLFTIWGGRLFRRGNISFFFLFWLDENTR